MQSLHAVADPQAVAELPAVHMPLAPPQQKPAPQPPPSQSALQLPPVQVGVSPPHSVHAAPVEPHSPSALPGAQSVPAQHPPWHVRPPAQLAPQAPLAGSHA